MDKRDAGLHRISQTLLTVKSPDRDVRGRAVVDSAGAPIGVVDDLLIDLQEEKVRFLRVAVGGILGVGAAHHLVPTAAITAITPHAVHIDRSREHVVGGPGYDVALTTDPAYGGELYLMGGSSTATTALPPTRTPTMPTRASWTSSEAIREGVEHRS